MKSFVPAFLLSGTAILTFASLAGGVGCGGITGLSASNPDSGGAVEAGLATDSGDASAASDDGATPQQDSGDARAPLKDPDSGALVGCVVAADCNGGSCFEGVCMCPLGSWIQANGSCGATPPPSCAAHGGTCSTLDPMNQACPRGSLWRSVAADCDSAEGKVCCVDSTTCHGRDVLERNGCYVRGTDAAYVPWCVNGWATCAPGDSPELQIP